MTHWDKNTNSYLERSILLHAHLLPPTDRAMTPTPLVFLEISKLSMYIANRYDHNSPPKFANIREPNLKFNFKIQWAYHLHSAQDGNENKWFGIAQKQYHNSHDWHFGHFPSRHVKQPQPFVSVFKWKGERDNLLCWARTTQKSPLLNSDRHLLPITGGYWQGRPSLKTQTIFLRNVVGFSPQSTTYVQNMLRLYNTTRSELFKGKSQALA